MDSVSQLYHNYFIIIIFDAQIHCSLDISNNDLYRVVHTQCLHLPSEIWNVQVHYGCRKLFHYTIY